jgi:hypothetical protein
MAKENRKSGITSEFDNVCIDQSAGKTDHQDLDVAKQSDLRTQKGGQGSHVNVQASILRRSYLGKGRERRSFQANRTHESDSQST